MSALRSILAILNTARHALSVELERLAVALDEAAQR
jgi:hypothetical protein